MSLISTKSCFAYTVVFIVGALSGYSIKAKSKASEEKIIAKLPANWTRIARRKWPGLSTWNDNQINAMLGTAVGFRSAFDECSTKDDEEVQTLLIHDPGTSYALIGSCLQGLPPDATLVMPNLPINSVPATWTK